MRGGTVILAHYQVASHYGRYLKDIIKPKYVKINKVRAELATSYFCTVGVYQTGSMHRLIRMVDGGKVIGYPCVF